MKLGKGLRSAAAMVLSAATLLAMGALGVGTANATEVDLSGANSKGQITITKGASHTFEMVKLSSYTYAETDSGTNLSVVSVDTAADPVLTAVQKAVKKANGDVTPTTGYESTNPMEYVAKTWSDSSSSPYTGTIRTFVKTLAADTSLTYGSVGTAAASGDDLVITDMPVGIYLLRDTTATAGVSKSVPILVGTTVGGTSYITLGGTTKPLGKVDLKAETPTLTKEATKLTSGGTDTTLTGSNRETELKKAKIGDTVEFTLSSKVPVTAGMDSYTFTMTDTPTKGMVYVPGSAALTVTDGIGAIGDVDVTEPSPSAPGTAVTFAFKGAEFVKQDKFPTGKAIKLTYKVTLTAVSGDTWQSQHNAAKLTYSTDPSTPATTSDVNADATTKIALYSVTLTNVDGQGTAIANDGAFKVYAGTSSSGTQLKFKANGTTAYTYDETGTDAAITTNGDGKLVFDGLPSGDYYIQQTGSSNNYTKSSFVVHIAYNLDGTASVTAFTNDPDTIGLVGRNSITQDSPNGYNGKITVKNTNSLAGLPLTGGVGVALVVLLAIISGGVAVVTSKMRRKNLANARM
ncbi:SpaA isopeptide-forming pilin-related protein [Bifidobacterium sp. ESL0732]|uniref:SpaA isopeptide-forming pilin-related protein n=1 Tax=Bifidobacterium sp. ESL0732 TaxID=2983222 RepID=UPI0023F806F1|nr:SpaA isopeptide-forming pilin-related protein [Bifidobacterium sp. ESL0732]WEV64019.1 SpaA isopeptide-forming pilin-related protein [Bifidobacterium sp. ESL0732]